MCGEITRYDDFEVETSVFLQALTFTFDQTSVYIYNQSDMLVNGGQSSAVDLSPTFKSLPLSNSR